MALLATSCNYAEVVIANTKRAPQGVMTLRSRLVASLLLLCILPCFGLLNSAFGVAEAQTVGAAISVNTDSDFDKSNQSKVFYHDGKWWALALLTDVSDWYIWRHDSNTNTWTQTLLITTTSSRIPDAVLDAANNRLFLMLSNDSKPDFFRLTYSGGTWTIDSGFPVRLSDFLDDGANRVSLVRAKNGDLWLFRIANNTLQTKQSTNNGTTWSSVISVKSGLNNSGVTDAVAFTSSSGNHLGVAYGETSITGSRFGFLIHKDTDANNVWVDESSNLTLTGSGRAMNELCATVDAANNVFLLTQNANASGSEARNTLFKRSASNTWQTFSVNTSATWTSPAVAIHPNGGALHVMGINSTTGQGEYKTCAVGQENSLAAATTAILFSEGDGQDDFVHLSVPAFSNFGAATTLMVCADNATAQDIWFHELGGTSGGGDPTPGAVTVGNVTLSSNLANTNSSYTIPITLGSNGALASGSGTITLQFPNNTLVPGSIASNQVQVNGNNAANVTPNNATREIVITTPIALADNASLNIVINAAAGLLNPTAAGNYALQAHTSAQTTPGTSPNYSISPAAMTQVSVATVFPNPTTLNSAAAYAITFNLGSNGQLVSGSSTIIITFNNATGVANGSLSGALVNGVGASASGNSGSKTVTLTVPASLQLSNNASITINLPTGLTNPNSANNYTLTVATSVETAPVTSNAYSITNTAPPPSPSPTGEDFLIAGTVNGYDKPNQNRPFYHDSHWWTAARKSSDGQWYLWKLTGSDWTAGVKIDDRAGTRPDCFLDAPSNKLYVLLASTSGSGTKFSRLTYSGGSFSIDSGFPVTLSNFTHTGEYCTVLTKAKNGDLWAFRLKASKVDAMKSGNSGASWSSIITIKTVGQTTGLVDATTFTSGGENYVGVGYAENTASGAIYGFLKHKDGDSDGSWNDETGSMPQPNGADGDDHMSLTVAPNNDVYFIYKTHPNSGSAPGIGLFKRTASGNWSNHTVQQGGGWTRPAVVVDETNNELYVMGTQEGSPENAQYKKCSLGNESSLAGANAIDLMDNGGFNNISVPRHPVNGTMDMLACAEDQSGGIWYVLLPINGGGGGGTPTALAVNSVSVNPNTASLTAAYTISMTLGSTGALEGDNDTFTITWPSGTTIPASIATSAVTVNGSGAGAVTTIPASRQVTVTVPNDLANSASVTLAFLNGAGLINPSAGNYTLQARTSAQTSNVTSPSYSIVAGASSTPLAVNSVSVTPTTVALTGQYNINLTLGSLGALTANSGTITVTWPNNTTVPASIANAAVSVNGVSAANVVTNVANRQALVTVPNALANNANVTLIFNSSAGLVNPTTAGNYAVQVQTSAQPSNVSSPNYSIAAASSSALTVNNVSVTPDTATRTAQYTIGITLGNNGALAANSGTITVTWPDNTIVPASMTNSAVLVNGASATNVVTNSAIRQATVTVPSNLANSANLTLIFESSAGLVNPTAAGNYTLQVRTSAQASDVASPSYTLNALPAPPPGGNAGSLMSAGTDATLDRSGQGKLFYFQNAWWLIAFDSVATDWHLWKFASGVWTRDLKVESRAPVRLDAVLDSVNSKLYYVASHEKNTKVGRLIYSGGTWLEEMAASVTDFGHGKTGNAVMLARANNGELWLFRMNVNALEAKVSTNNGATWSATLVLKSGISGTNGTVEGVTFRANSVNRIGVFYGMTAANGGLEYGFLQHQDGAAQSSWTDESANLTYFNNERGDNWFNAQVTPQGKIYLLTRNSNATAAGEVTNTLYERATSGAWQKFKVTVNSRWNSPVVAVDASQQRVYVFGVRNDSPNLAEYKSCAFGSETTLETQTATTVLKKDSNNFGDLAGPVHPVYASMGMMLCGGNVTTNDVWYNHFISATPKLAANEGGEEIKIAADTAPEVAVYPNPFNPATTIRFRLHEPARVRLRIFDVRGALVRNLLDRDMHTGIYESRWNGKDRDGQTVASGLYFYRLEINNKVLRGRLEMVK